MRIIPRIWLLLALAIGFASHHRVVGAEDLSPEEGLSRLETYVAKVSSFAAGFHQQLLDDQQNLIQESHGHLKIMRPGRFRWDYQDPFVQAVISDGDKLWLYDEDLAQASVRNLDGTLADTPAMLLSGEGDVSSAYTVERVYVDGEETWLVLNPIRQDTDFNGVSLGFVGDQVRYMELTDNLDQITRIEFFDIQTNLPFDESVFTFEAPEGVDIIGAN